MSIWFTRYEVMVSYQYISSSCYRKIHPLRLISCYCTLVYNEYVNLLGFIFPLSKKSAYITSNCHKVFLITQILNQLLLWYFKSPFFGADTEYTTFQTALTVQTHQTKKYAHQEKTLKDGDISGVGWSCKLLLQQKGASV